MWKVTKVLKAKFASQQLHRSSCPHNCLENVQGAHKQPVLVIWLVISKGLDFFQVFNGVLSSPRQPREISLNLKVPSLVCLLACCCLALAVPGTSPKRNCSFTDCWSTLIKFLSKIYVKFFPHLVSLTSNPYSVVVQDREVGWGRGERVLMKLWICKLHRNKTFSNSWLWQQLS